MHATATQTMAPTTYTGPALVTEVDACGSVTCLVGDGLRAITPAMPMAYQPAEGDLLLVTATDQGCWSIGVIQGRGACHLQAEGDISISSRQGAVRLQGHTACELDSPHTTVRGRRLELIADSLIQRCKSLAQRVSGLLKTRAERRNTDIDNSDQHRAGSLDVRCKKRLHLNGERIHLG